MRVESDEESFWTQRPKAHTVCLTVFVQIQVCSDQIYLTIVTFYIFLLLLNEKRDLFLPSGLWIVLFWLPAETLSLKRLREPRIDRQFTT